MEKFSIRIKSKDIERGVKKCAHVPDNKKNKKKACESPSQSSRSHVSLTLWYHSTTSQLNLGVKCNSVSPDGSIRIDRLLCNLLLFLIDICAVSKSFEQGNICTRVPLTCFLTC